MTKDKVKALEFRAKVLENVCNERMERLERLTTLLHDKTGTINTTHSLIKLMYSTRTNANDTINTLVTVIDNAGRDIIKIAEDVRELRMNVFERMKERNEIQNEIDKLKGYTNVADTSPLQK